MKIIPLLLLIASPAFAQDDGGRAYSERCFRRFDRCARSAGALDEFVERAWNALDDHGCHHRRAECLFGEDAPEVHWTILGCGFDFDSCTQGIFTNEPATLRAARRMYRECVQQRNHCHETADITAVRYRYTGPTLEELRREERCHLTFSVCMDANPVLGLRDCQLRYRRCIAR